jgi:nitrite reductase (NO-forming)
MMNRRNLLLSAALLTLTMAAPALAADEPKLPRQHVDLVAPPFVHPHEQATKAGPKIIEFTLNIEEKKVVIDAEGTTFQAMTFNGSMPGPLMVVHEGDYVEVKLVNPATSTSIPPPAPSAAPSSRWSTRARKSRSAGRPPAPAPSSITARRAAR